MRKTDRSHGRPLRAADDMVTDELIMFGAGDRFLIDQRFDVPVEYGFFLIGQFLELSE